MSGASPPNSPYTCVKAEPPMRALPCPKSTSSSMLSATGLMSGVTVLRTSCTGAKAVAIRLNGDTTDFCSVPSCHTVFMERLSLPTGMLTPISRHICDTASTVR